MISVARKKEIAKKLIESGDEILLLNIERMMNSDDDAFMSQYPESLKRSIARGIAQADAGEVIPHENVVNELKKKYGL